MVVLSLLMDTLVSVIRSYFRITESVVLLAFGEDITPIALHSYISAFSRLNLIDGTSIATQKLPIN